MVVESLTLASLDKFINDAIPSVGGLQELITEAVSLRTRLKSNALYPMAPVAKSTLARAHSSAELAEATLLPQCGTFDFRDCFLVQVQGRSARRPGESSLAAPIRQAVPAMYWAQGRVVAVCGDLVKFNLPPQSGKQ